ncbi:MAG: hypothetical protein U0W24_25865 [Bacteroidales bacterium]
MITAYPRIGTTRFRGGYESIFQRCKLIDGVYNSLLYHELRSSCQGLALAIKFSPPLNSIILANRIYKWKIDKLVLIL